MKIKQALSRETPEGYTESEHRTYRHSLIKLLGGLSVSFVGIPFFLDALNSDSVTGTAVSLAAVIGGLWLGESQAPIMAEIDSLASRRPQAEALPLEFSPDN